MIIDQCELKHRAINSPFPDMMIRPISPIQRSVEAPDPGSSTNVKSLSPLTLNYESGVLKTIIKWSKCYVGQTIMVLIL